LFEVDFFQLLKFFLSFFSLFGTKTKKALPFSVEQTLVMIITIVFYSDPVLKLFTVWFSNFFFSNSKPSQYWVIFSLTDLYNASVTTHEKWNLKKHFCLTGVV